MVEQKESLIQQQKTMVHAGLEPATVAYNSELRISTKF